jgi:hypothetical protein
MPGCVTNGKAARRQNPQAVVVVGGDPDLDLGSARYLAQPGTRLIEGEDLLPGQAFPSGPVRAVLGHTPAVAQPAPRIVKFPELAETAESARAGIVVRSADVPITAIASAPLRSRLSRLRARVAAGVGEGDMAVRS